MDQHRDVLATDERQADRIQRQKSLDELHKLVDRVHAVQLEYRELVRCARRNFQDAQILKKEMDTFVERIEQSPLPNETSSGGSTETSMEPKP